MPGSLPLLFKLRILFLEEFALCGIIEQHDPMPGIDSGYHYVVKWETGAWFESCDQRAAFDQMTLKIIPFALEHKCAISVLLEVALHV